LDNSVRQIRLLPTAYSRAIYLSPSAAEDHSQRKNHSGMISGVRSDSTWNEHAWRNNDRKHSKSNSNSAEAAAAGATVAPTVAAPVPAAAVHDHALTTSC
jgi:hypothetical protein